MLLNILQCGDDLGQKVIISEVGKSCSTLGFELETGGKVM